MFYSKTKKFLFTLILSIFFISLSAQYHLNGDAAVLNDECFQLTPAQDGKSGSVWFTPEIDLRESFDITAELHFGCTDGDGADGITFSLHTSTDALGGGGQGQGFHYLWPSLGIEFDNTRNSNESDPSYDHIAIVSQGIVNHDEPTNLAGPVQTDPNSGNVEDCEYHDIRITWDAFQKKLDVYYDCQWRTGYTGNIVSSIFQGDPIVYWGFTAATGALNNKQIACVRKVKIRKPLSDYSMCSGGSIQLEAAEGQSYIWSPATGLSNPNIRNPLASPNQNTTYQVKVTDGCTEFIDTVFIEVVNALEVDFGFADTTLCDGRPVVLDATTPGATYLWSSGETNSAIMPERSGYYVVTVTLEADGEECTANDAAQVNFIKLPSILFTEYTSICEGETIILNAGFPEATYSWQDGSTDSIFVVTESGLYSVTVDHFCESKTYKADIGFEMSCTDVYIPSAFSPNYDGTNEHFMIMDGGDIIIIDHLRILDRWGSVVFEARNFPPNDREYGWDGSFEGKQVKSGVYVYFAEVTFRDKSAKVLVGEINVIR